jgi:hypothetical protein
MLAPARAAALDDALDEILRSTIAVASRLRKFGGNVLTENLRQIGRLTEDLNQILEQVE